MFLLCFIQKVVFLFLGVLSTFNFLYNRGSVNQNKICSQQFIILSIMYSCFEDFNKLLIDIFWVGGS